MPFCQCKRSIISVQVVDRSSGSRPSRRPVTDAGSGEKEQGCARGSQQETVVQLVNFFSLQLVRDETCCCDRYWSSDSFGDRSTADMEKIDRWREWDRFGEELRCVGACSEGCSGGENCL